MSANGIISTLFILWLVSLPVWPHFNAWRERRAGRCRVCKAPITHTMIEPTVVLGTSAAGRYSYCARGHRVSLGTSVGFGGLYGG